MSSKVLRVELASTVLSRHMDALKDCQGAIEEVSESRPILSNYDPFLKGHISAFSRAD